MSNKNWLLGVLCAMGRKSRGDVYGHYSGINQTSLLPELLYAPNNTLNLKTGLTFGAGDGNQFGGQAEIDIFF